MSLRLPKRTVRGPASGSQHQMLSTRHAHGSFSPDDRGATDTAASPSSLGFPAPGIHLQPWSGPPRWWGQEPPYNTPKQLSESSLNNVLEYSTVIPACFLHLVSEDIQRDGLDVRTWWFPLHFFFCLWMRILCSQDWILHLYSQQETTYDSFDPMRLEGQISKPSQANRQRLISLSESL